MRKLLSRLQLRNQDIRLSHTHMIFPLKYQSGSRSSSSIYHKDRRHYKKAHVSGCTVQPSHTSATKFWARTPENANLRKHLLSFSTRKYVWNSPMHCIRHGKCLYQEWYPSQHLSATEQPVRFSGTVKRSDQVSRSDFYSIYIEYQIPDFRKWDYTERMKRRSSDLRLKPNLHHQARRTIPQGRSVFPGYSFQSMP